MWRWERITTKGGKSNVLKVALPLDAVGIRRDIDLFLFQVWIQSV